LSETKNIAIETTSPSTSSVSGISGSYSTNDTIDISITTSEAVTVTGSAPYGKIALNTGPYGTAYATYISGSGSTTLTFQLTVQGKMRTLDLEYVSTSAFTTDGGIFTDTAGNPLVLTLPATGSGNSLSDTSDIIISAPGTWQLGTGGDYDSFGAFAAALSPIPGDSFTYFSPVTETITTQGNSTAGEPITLDGGGHNISGGLSCPNNYWSIQDITLGGTLNITGSSVTVDDITVGQ
jgi:hypothetical protein